MRAIVFDVETTGLPASRRISITESHKWPYVVQISWLVFDLGSNKIVTCSDHLIRLPSGTAIPQESTNIHGISTEMMLEKGVHIKPVLARFISDVKGCKYVVAHNIEFDKKMILAEMYRNGFSDILSKQRKLEFCTMKYGEPICGLTMISSRTGKPMSKFPKLLELHKKLFSSVPRNLHNSMVDVLACFRCFYKLIYDVDALTTNRGLRELWIKCGL
jgi:DNA polymerase-3 subunit epsilon